jgi:Cdc6-like AAA superfamily ATPase
MAVLRGPFPTGGTVGQDDLVDREAILTEMFGRTYEHLNSVVLSAPRQTGKTSVAEELLRQVRRAGGWGIYIDCSAATDERELAELIARSTYDQASGSRGAFTRLKDIISGAPKPVLFQNDLNLSLMFFGDHKESPPRLLERAFGLADELATQKDRRCVVVYDEFQRLAALSPSIFERTRAALQHRMTHTAYVFMGSEVGLLDALFRQRTSMPFRLATPLTLPPPSSEAWHRYIAARFRNLKVVIAADEVDRLIAFSGGHPRDLMEICEHLLTIRSVNPTVAGAVDLAEAKTLAGLSAEFEEIWKQLERPRGTRTTAARIAAGRPVYGEGRPGTETARSIDKLAQMGLIRKMGRGAYEFTEPLFGVFVRNLTQPER